MPEYRTNPNYNFTEQVMKRFHKVNEPDGTLNEVHCLFCATNISSNKRFTFGNAMKQYDKLAFVDDI